MNSCSPQDGEPRRKRRRQSSVSAVRTSETATSPQELGHMRPSPMQGSSSFVGSGSGIYFVRTVQSSFARNYRQESEVIDEELVPGEDDRLQTHTSGSLWNSDEVLYSSSEQLPNPSTFNEMVRWSQSYFNNWHPPFPFLHAPSVLGLLEKITTQGIESLSTVDLIIVRSVLSISVADRRQMPPDNHTRVPSYLVYNTINDAISSLNPIMLQPSTLAGLQALVSIQLFLVSMLRLNAASRIGGLITRIAYHLGLHRCPSRFKQFSSADVDIRRRLFWAIYSLERYLSQSLGLPLDLKDDDIDVCFPDKELHLETDSRDVQSHHPRLLLPAFLARHGRIKGLILELRHKAVVHRTTDAEEVSYVDAEISKWWNEAQDLLDPHYSYDEGSEKTNSDQALLKDSHKLLLIVQKHESTILLNRPVITSGHNTLLYEAAMQKCIGASKQIVSKIYQHLYNGTKDVDASDDQLNSPLFWPGFTWCIWMSGLILLYAASEGHYSVQVAQRESERCVKILEVLSRRGNFWPSACASALRDLQQALMGTRERELAVKTSQISQNTETRHRPQEALNQHLHGISNRPSQSRGSDTPSRAQANSYASSGSQRIESQQAPNMNQYIPQNASIRPLTASFEGMQPGISEHGQPPQSQAYDTVYNDIWPAINYATNPMGEQINGFDDIFQLMDVPYQLSEQFYEPSEVTRH